MFKYKLILITLLSSNVWATVDTSIANLRWQSYKRASAGDVRGAIEGLEIGVRQLEREFTPNSIVAEMNTQFTEYRKEVVTHTEESNRDLSLGFSAFFDAIFGLGQAWNHTRVDVTKIITLNPAETAQFPAKVQRDLQLLRSKVHQHIALHINEIVLAKYLAIEAYRIIAAGDTSKWTSAISREDLKEIDSISQEYSFGGTHNVTACISTDYTDHVTHHDEGESIAARFIFFKFGYLNQREKTTTYHAHNETECTFSNQTIWESTAPYLVIDLAKLDQRIAQWRAQAQLRLQYSKEPNLAPRNEPFQTWGIE